MLYQWKEDKIIFVIRLKRAIKHQMIKQLALPENKAQELYPEKLRRVVIYDNKNRQTIELITNNFSWTASTIAELYKQRWMIEIFFKELKQHLKIKSFIGINENAMLIQIWTALISLLLFRYLQTIARYPWHLSNLIAFLRMNLFVKILLTDWRNNPFKPPEDFSMEQRQEKLF